MLNLGRMTVAIAVAALALPAAAGSWPNIPARKAQAKAQVVALQSPDGFVEAAGDAGSSLEQYRYFPSEEFRGKKSFATSTVAISPVAQQIATPGRSVGGFEFIGGEAGWQLAPHKFVWATNRFVMSDECDHVIRIVTGPTPVELETARQLSPGA